MTESPNTADANKIFLYIQQQEIQDLSQGQESSPDSALPIT